jgi:hypothetical protein
VSAWPRVERVGLAVLLAGPLAGAAQSDDPATEASAHLAAGRYGAALESAGRVGEPGLAAEWSFHVLNAGGDLPGALAAAEVGLAAVPDNPRLLENAARTAHSLGLGREARGHAERLTTLAGLDRTTLERARTLLSEAEALERREDTGRRGVARARATAVLLLVAALAGLLFLARRARG